MNNKQDICKRMRSSSLFTIWCNQVRVAVGQDGIVRTGFDYTAKEYCTLIVKHFTQDQEMVIFFSKRLRQYLNVK